MAPGARARPPTRAGRAFASFRARATAERARVAAARAEDDAASRL
jgi:hypothetical protein